MSLSCPDTNTPERSFAATGRLFRPFARFAASIVGGYLRLSETTSMWRSRLRQRRELQELSDHVLKDIGISRCDVFRESSKYFWHE
jgi:uncharacterized protein YjiS (DUF1127 family)